VAVRSLYVHIPFCAHLCAYCDFPKVLFQPKWAFSYVEELKKEAASCSIAPHSLDTLYFGGGTPSVLPNPLLKELLSYFAPFLKQGGEFTLEGNPESLDEAKLTLLRQSGVNRLSIGVESADPALLALMGRHHSFAEAKRSVVLAKQAGFTNINCDLIYALPGEDLTALRKDIDALLSLDVDHLSTYCLSVNPGTLFHNQGRQEMEQSLAADQYELILKCLRAAGYDRYEVSNFCRKGKKSRHNLTYWKDEEYYGLGMGASGYVAGVRYDNVRNLSAYLAGQWRANEEKIDQKSALEYYFLTNLRLEEGFSEADFEKKFGFSFAEAYAPAINKALAEGLAEAKGGRFYASDKGILLLDRLLVALY
jgi:oxygen-independent coproporphyrinogen-3 oxidase